ncbi:MAG: sulfotransferase domain-containing protein [Okeania sp. SIO2D1]|nr:sulfotransferase domain-containing protein [Okeania sp. SIO2D1]
MDDRLTVFHITHQKAGSQWVAAVLKLCAPDRYVLPETQGKHFSNRPIMLGGVYPSVYLSKPNFEALIGAKLRLSNLNSKHSLHSTMNYITNWYNFQVQKHNYKKFIIIRDLRDALVSAYFSFKISHVPLTENLCRWRENLNSLDKEQGLLYLMNESSFPNFANIQSSWLGTEALLIKYEDLVADEYGVFEQIMNHCQIDIKRQRLHEIIESNSFKAMTGRQQGQENINDHQRKGVAGDWRNHFSDHIKEEFKQRFGDLVIKGGYEKNMNW